MRKLILGGFAIALTISMAVGSADALVIVNDGGCLIHDASGGLTFRAVDTDAVVTRDGCTVVCETRLDAGAKATFDSASTGGSCGIEGCGFTESWTQTMSADGAVTLTCSGSAATP